MAQVEYVYVVLVDEHRRVGSSYIAKVFSTKTAAEAYTDGYPRDYTVWVSTNKVYE